ncbi:MAG: ABC transporter substrate-binding protein, partial [Chloroflexota bacterium]
MGSALLAACGAGAGGSQPAAPEGARVTGTTEFWQWGTSYNPGFQTLTDEFNEKKSGVTVDFLPAADDYWDKLTAALAGDVGPDVFLMNTNARAWWAQGQLRDLSDLVKRDKAASNDHGATLKAFDEWYRPDGKISGMPWDYSTISTDFNLAHLKEAGLTSPADLGDKWTWTTLLEYAQKLTKRGATPQD